VELGQVLLRGGFDLSQDVDGLQPAHVDHYPKDIGLSHEQGDDSQHNGPDISQEPWGPWTDAQEVISVGNEHHQGREDVGVIEAGEEEDNRKERNVNARMKRIKRQATGDGLAQPLCLP